MILEQRRSDLGQCAFFYSLLILRHMPFDITLTLLSTPICICRSSVLRLPAVIGPKNLRRPPGVFCVFFVNPSDIIAISWDFKYTFYHWRYMTHGSVMELGQWIFPFYVQIFRYHYFRSVGFGMQYRHYYHRSFPLCNVLCHVKTCSK